MSSWAFLSRFDIRDEATGELYLRRWRVVQTPWFAVYVHRILRPDKDRDLHDHPWSFVSWVLWGWYREVRAARDGWFSRPRHLRRWLSLAWHRAERAHRIIEVRPGGVWTLVLTGRRRREWGFHTRWGWVDWRRYLGVEAES